MKDRDNIYPTCFNIYRRKPNTNTNPIFNDSSSNTWGNRIFYLQIFPKRKICVVKKYPKSFDSGSERRQSMNLDNILF